MAAIVMAAIESVCLAFLLVILIAYLCLPRSGSLRRDWFFFCLISVMLGLAADMISWACESGPSARWLQYSSNTLCLMATGFIITFYTYYEIDIIREKKPMPWLCARVAAFVNIGGSVAVLVAACCGKLYSIVPYPNDPKIMIYMAGGFVYDIPVYLASLSLIVLFAIVMHNARFLNRRRIIAFSVFFLLPLLSAVLELIVEALQFSYAFTSISMVIVYVVLQSNRMDELLLRERLLNEWSYVDALTGLLNRRAFDRDTEADAGEETVGIAFCDLNGLKKVNDEKGHQAGDQYLISFAEMLVRHFSHDCIYRISGDEFVVIARGIGNEEFNGCLEGLRREIDEHSEMAAFGAVYGTGRTVSGMLKEAELKMYDDKEKFYQRNPSYKRRRTDN